LTLWRPGFKPGHLPADREIIFGTAALTQEFQMYPRVIFKAAKLGHERGVNDLGEAVGAETNVGA